MVIEVSGVVHTEAGMMAVWDAGRCAAVEPGELTEDADIQAAVTAGHLVPLNIRADGAFQLTLRLGAELTTREAEFRMLSAEPYLLEVTGEVRYGGIEHVGGDTGEPSLTPPPGRYQAFAHIVDWAAEPGSRDAEGHPAEHALSDFVVLLEPEPGTPPAYRTDLLTFGEPQASAR